MDLIEALRGFRFPLVDLDGRELLTGSDPRKIIKPRLENDEGMPHYQRSSMKACYFARFNVELFGSAGLVPDRHLDRVKYKARRV